MSAGINGRSGFAKLIVAAAVLPVLHAGVARACQDDGDIDPRVGIWAVLPSGTSNRSPGVVTALSAPSIDTYVSSWLINTTGLKGRSTDATINAAVSSIASDLQEERYTGTNVYVLVTGIPAYYIGAFPGNPNIPTNINATFDIPRNPQPASGTHTATGLGAIGVLVNGVPFFNMSDAHSYQNLNVWHNNAGVVEAPSFDAAKGHPQQQGEYHNHMDAVSLISELGGSSSNPVVIGYAIDGYPVFNDYASTSPGGPVEHMTSSYQLKSYASNVRGSGGPNVSAQYPLGYFEEDYQYVQGSGLLDQYDGAFVYTPQFPSGTYGYFATVDNAGNAAYPYLVGPSYYGTPSSDDLPNGTVTVPADAISYVPEPAGFLLVGAALLPLLRRRRARR
jgi:hypothetical protein